MTLDELINEKEKSVESGKREIKQIVDGARASGREYLTEAESFRSNELFDAVDRDKDSLKQLRKLKAEEDELDRRSLERYPTGAAPSVRAASVRVGREPLTYRSEGETARNFDGTPAEPTFLQDIYRAQILGDPAAMTRLQRHGDEMSVEQPGLVKRAVGSSGVPGFVPPAYLAEDFAAYARAGRPTAELCRKMPLPAEGMSVNLPRITTPTKTGVQTAENNTLANQDPASTLLTSPVVTIGGYTSLSRQAVERGQLTEQVVVQDLAADYAAQLDAQILTGSGTGGQHLGMLNVTGINSVAFTSTTPTVPLLFPKLASALQAMWSGRFAGPSAFVTSPREWAWIVGQVDSSNRPLVEPSENGPYNAIGTMATAGYTGQAGTILNVPVIMDGNLPDNLGTGTNESRFIAANFSDIYLWEENGGLPSQIRAEQPSAASLGILYVAYGYSAFAAGRLPRAISVVSGTGMVTPSL